MLCNGHKEDVLAAGYFVHHSSHFLYLFNLQVIEAQIMFGVEGGSRLCYGEELSVAMPLIVEITDFIDHKTKGPDFIANKPIGVRLSDFPILDIGGVEGVAVDDDIVI